MGVPTIIGMSFQGPPVSPVMVGEWTVFWGLPSLPHDPWHVIFQPGTSPTWLGIFSKERGASVVDPNHYINQAMIHAAKIHNVGGYALAV